MDWFGIPRKEIDWYPRIDYDRCIGCGLCFLTCGGRVVYDWDFEKMKPIVARPYNCMVGMRYMCKAMPTRCNTLSATRIPKKNERQSTGDHKIQENS